MINNAGLTCHLAAQVRRIILTGLPPAWANPSKALSLVHTGVIDKINVSPAGNAHIYFYDHNACKAFFDNHPNGIGIGSHNVYVERGKEVDVVSSQLALNRSLGATRVLRAVGVDMDTTMIQLHQIASGQNRKVEKIVDSYSPGEVRLLPLPSSLSLSPPEISVSIDKLPPGKDRAVPVL